jgi:hypothetical protein
MSVVGVAAAPVAQEKPAAKVSKTKAAKHATMGVVKSIDATALVITRPGKDGGEMTFSLNPSTQRKGTIDVGSRVSVRYTDDGSTHVANAITARARKTAASKGSAAH